MYAKLRDATLYMIGWSIYTVLILAVSGAWFTHIFMCFTQNRWGFLIAGAIFFPVAVVHGFGLWLGIW